jgi:hypothetical protein
MANSLAVMAGLVPAIHDCFGGGRVARRTAEKGKEGVDGRDKPGHDERGTTPDQSGADGRPAMTREGLTACRP